MFGILDGSQDYIMPFSCEYGVKANGSYDYITYSTLNYTIQNIYQNDIIHEKLCAPHMSIWEWKEVVSRRIP